MKTKAAASKTKKATSTKASKKIKDLSGKNPKGGTRKGEPIAPCF